MTNHELRVSTLKAWLNQVKSGGNKSKVNKPYVKLTKKR